MSIAAMLGSSVCAEDEEGEEADDESECEESEEESDSDELAAELVNRSDDDQLADSECVHSSIAAMLGSCTIQSFPFTLNSHTHMMFRNSAADDESDSSLPDLHAQSSSESDSENDTE